MSALYYLRMLLTREDALACQSSSCSIPHGATGFMGTRDAVNADALRPSFSRTCQMGREAKINTIFLPYFIIIDHVFNAELFTFEVSFCDYIFKIHALSGINSVINPRKKHFASLFVVLPLVAVYREFSARGQPPPISSAHPATPPGVPQQDRLQHIQNIK